MVQKAISFNDQTYLVFVENGFLTANHYIQEIIAEHFLPFAPFIDDFLLTQENVHPHVA